MTCRPRWATPAAGRPHLAGQIAKTGRALGFDLMDWQHEVNAGRSDALDRLDGAGEFAFQRAGFLDALLEVRLPERVCVVEDFVADSAAGGQAGMGEQHAGLGDLVGRDVDLCTAGFELIGDMRAAELVRHLAGIAQVEVAVEQRHARRRA